MSQKLKTVKKSEEEERRRYKTKDKKEIKKEKVTVSKKVEKLVEQKSKINIPEVQFTKIRESIKIQPTSIKSDRETKIKVPDVIFQSIKKSSEVTTPALAKEVSSQIIIPSLSAFSEIGFGNQVSPVQQHFDSFTKILPPRIHLEKISLSEISFSQASRLISGADACKKIEEEKEKEEQKETQIISISEGAGKGGERIPDLFDIIFKNKRGHLSRKILGEGTKLILIYEPKGSKYRGTVEKICLKLYREKKGGFPEAKIINKIDGVMTPEIYKWMDTKGKIFSIDFENKDKEIDKKEWGHVKGRLEELFTGNIGFLILSSKSDNDSFELPNKNVIFFPKDFVPLLKIIPSLSHQPKIICLIPNELDFETKKKTCSYVWGFVNLDDQAPSFADDFDLLFDLASQRFEMKLDAIKEEDDYIYDRATNEHRGENESSEHFKIKRFVVRYLSKKLNLPKDVDEIKNRIKTEKQEDNDEIPDIEVDSEVYEIETLFGTGHDPIKKVDKTINKYEAKEGLEKKKINVVLDCLSALLHINELKARKKNKKVDVKFFVPDVEKNKLLNLDEFVSGIFKIPQNF